MEHNTRKLKRAQMEIMGLMIVVILLSLGMLFVIKFVYLEEDTNIRREHSESQLSANLLNSLLQMTATDCGDQQIKSLLRDCALSQEILCDMGQDSCEYLNETIYKVLNSTLVLWGKSFYFNASETDITYGDVCPAGYDSKFYPVQAQDKTVIVTLEICN